ACIRRPSEPFTPADAAKVTCPTLVIIGDRDFAGPPEPLVEALPDAQLVVLKGVDHFRSPIEFACIDAALEFVEAVPGEWWRAASDSEQPPAHGFRNEEPF